MRLSYIFVLFLSGCAIGPTYKRPEIRVPAQYCASLGNKTEKVEYWWQVFEDDILERLICDALAQNLDVQIALEKIEESRNLKNITIANICPQINFFASVAKTNPLVNGLAVVNPLATLFNKTVDIDTLWEIDIWGRLRKLKNSATASWEAQIADMYDVSIMLAAEIAQNYINVCALQEKIKIVEHTLALNQEILNLYKYMFGSGLEDEQVPLEQVTACDQAHVQINGFKIDLQTALHQIAYLLGQTPDQVYLDLSHIRGVPAVKKDITIDEPYMLLRVRPDIRKAERLLAASNEDIGAAMGDWFPKVQLLGIAGRVMISAIQSSKIWTIGSLFGWPIIDFGRVRYNVCAKESAYRQALLTYEKTVINAVKEVENGLVSYITEKNTGIILTHELEVEEKRLRCTYDLFVSGLEAEQVYLINRKRVDEIKLAFVDSQSKCAIDFVLLSKALGGSL